MRSITWSQASTQAAQPMHSYCRPLRMSMPVGHTSTHMLQDTQAPRPSAFGSAFFERAPRGSPRSASYVMIIVSLSNIELWKRAYGHMYLHTCSRMKPALP